MSETENNAYKWIVLAVFTAVAGVSQMLWLNFAPLISQLMVKYDQSESMISLLILVFPLLYVLFSIPSGSMIDKRGYKYAVGFGSVLMAIGAVLRIYNAHFYVLLIAQIIVAIGQPYVVNGISKLVADWFPKEEHALATGLGTVGMFVGMALGLGVTPALVHGNNITPAMIFFAVISVVSALVFILFTKEQHKDIHLPGEMSGLKEFRLLLKEKDLVLLLILSFLALGYFNGLTTWMEPILALNSFNAESAGLAGAMLILGGIVGSILIPAWSDKVKKRKPFLIGCCVIGLLITYPFLNVTGYSTLLIIGGVLGFFFLPGYALLLTMSEEIAGAEKAGAATSLLMLSGNAGGTIVIIAMQMVKGNQESWWNAILLMLILLVLALFIGSIVGESYDRQPH
ncbi:MAG: MFS transporter [Bacteroidetes bacterium]|nr:MFS transporter [Bacteroidota bacterium]